MKIINGKEFYSIKELGKILNFSFMGVFIFLRSRMIRCAWIGNRNSAYVSKEDILKSLDPEEKSDKDIISLITG